MNSYQRSLHQKALILSKQYKKIEAELLKVLIEVDRTKLYQKLNKRSLFQYSVETLGLSEATAYSFMNVARKCKEVPALLTAVEEQNLTVSKANKIVAALTNESSDDLLTFAQTHSTREIEFEVAKRNPKAPERLTIKPRSEKHVDIKMTVSLELAEKLERVAALAGTNLKDALEKMTDFYLYHKDPVTKAKRNSGKKTVHVKSKSKNIPEAIRHALYLKTNGQCTHTETNGTPCKSDRYIENHHILPRNQGGRHAIDNLTTLCSFHHKQIHRTPHQPTAATAFNSVSWRSPTGSLSNPTRTTRALDRDRSTPKPEHRGP